MSSAYRNFLTFGAHQKPTVGDTKTSVISNDHMGWLKCDGRLVAVADFEFLFNVVGYSFGGSGDSFRLPNPAGRVPGIVGTGTDSNLTNSTLTLALGSTIGEYQHTLTVAEMPTHSHGVTDPQHQHTGTTDNGGFAASGVNVNNLTTQIDVADNGGPGHTHTFTTNLNSTGITLLNTGSSNPHNNIQPTIGMGNMFIYCGRPTYPLVGYPYTEGTLIY
jgi:microcystin-dependent protein